MGLADRIYHSDTPMPYPSGEYISIHDFSAAMQLYYAGEATENQITNLFNLDDSQASGLSVLITELDGLSTDADKVKWLLKLDAAGIYYQNGRLDHWRSNQSIRPAGR